MAAVPASQMFGCDYSNIEKMRLFRQAVSPLTASIPPTPLQPVYLAFLSQDTTQTGDNGLENLQISLYFFPAHL